MVQDQALLPLSISHLVQRFPQFFSKAESKLALDVVLVATGVLLISALAQLVIVLPWTPVPITGQTFGVALVSLSWGRKRALMVMLAYLALGGLGLPIFAQGQSGLIFGKTFGYLMGMTIASYVMGRLADRGWTKSWKKSWLAAATGSCIVYSCGLSVLSFYVPANQLLMAGFLPFLPGDIIKTILSSGISNWAIRVKENLY